MGQAGEGGALLLLPNPGREGSGVCKGEERRREGKGGGREEVVWHRPLPSLPVLPDVRIVMSFERIER